MKKLTITLGYWSSFFCAFTFLVFTGCFIAIAVSSPVFTWSGIGAYAAYVSQYSQVYKYIAQFMMIVFGVSYLILTLSIFGCTPDEKKPLGKLSVFFALLFVAMISIHYFVQLTAVRMAFDKGVYHGFEHFVQGNPYSVMSAINMLGWTLFFGLSSLFAAFLMPTGTKPEKTARLFFFLNAAFCFLGGVGYALDIVPLVFLCINFGMGGSVIVISIALFLKFRRMRRQGE